MDLVELFLLLVCLFLIGIFIIVTVVIYITPNSDPVRKKLNGEEAFYDPSKGLGGVLIRSEVVRNSNWGFFQQARACARLFRVWMKHPLCR